MTGKITVGIIQASPVYLNLKESILKAKQLMSEATGKGAKLIVLGETWLPGYPSWLDYCPDIALWNHPPTKEVFAQLRQNSVSVPGKEMADLGELARKLNITLVIGVNEKIDSGPGNGTLYNSLITIGNTGEVINHHRKLVPTYTERMIWGQGDGAGLKAVDTPVGRVGGMICWEHWMPLTRQTLHISGEHIHIAAWPTVHEMHQIASRQYAFEGRCFVLAAGLIMKNKDIPSAFKVSPEIAKDPEGFVLKGGSAIIGPDGFYITEPVFNKETIIIAEIDKNEIDKEKMTLDATGHYNRNDIFNFSVNKNRH
jgi:nitrilase